MKIIKIDKFNRNGGITKKPGRKAKKELALTPKQAKFVEVFNNTGNESLAKKEAGYSENTKLTELRNSPTISPVIRDIRQELVDNAHVAYQVLQDIMMDSKVSAKVRSDVAINLMDRAGYKAVEKKEVTGSISGNVSSTLTLDLIQRTRELRAKKQEAIEIESVVID